MRIFNTYGERMRVNDGTRRAAFISRPFATNADRLRRRLADALVLLVSDLVEGTTAC